MDSKQMMRESTSSADNKGYTCPQCGNTGISTSIHQDKFIYGTGESALELIVDLPVRHCSTCNFQFLDSEAEEIKHREICRHLGVLPPEAILKIRRKHGFSRAAFAHITGLGEASLGRWEKGINIQNPGNDRYIRLLEHPEVMRQLREIAMRDDFKSLELKNNVVPFPHLKVTDVLLRDRENFLLRKAS